ncbi:peptidoglycan-binding protein [Epibacterium sp. SM1969]|uniref:Peptidoglycan-binding protein n=1 Tax=Tritonibacter aquimaris TaxID=2663379 RepID=A0A844AU91_9RHOB|nr:peptidoglycan-binding domain-containing protein [Tritonibacter aquimaris]MQY43397.1 peptidoglycan-binding protein [Tritonibacter aquimaris]
MLFIPATFANGLRIASLVLCCSACTATLPPGQTVRSAAVKAPPGAAAGTCWDTEIIPARIATLTQQEIISPAQTDANGLVVEPAVVRTVTRQVVTQPRQERWFETLCPAELSPDLLASLQRALSARGHYSGPVTGQRDRATKDAILKYQRRQGLESGTLSLENARKLGLISVAR